MTNPLEGPVFDTHEDAIVFTIGVMADHVDRGLGLSDARIQPFTGIVEGREVLPQYRRSFLKGLRKLARPAR